MVVIKEGLSSRIRLDQRIGERLRNIYHMPGHPIYEVIVWRMKDLKKLPPTKFLHDFHTAKCLYGKECKDIIPKVSASDIPPSEGLRVLFNRLHGLLIPFSPQLLYSVPDTQQSRHLMFETVKLILDSLGALLILDHIHFPTLRQNVNFVKKHSPRKFSKLNDRVPEAFELVEQALEYRLKPQREMEKNAVDLWFKARQMALSTLEIYLEELYRIKSDTTVNMVRNLIDSLPHPLTINLKATVRNLIGQKEFNPKFLYKRPWSAFLGVRILTLCSINRHGQLNTKLLDEATNILTEHTGFKIPQSSTSDLWTILKDHVIKNYIDPFSPHQISILSLL